MFVSVPKVRRFWIGALLMAILLPYWPSVVHGVEPGFGAFAEQFTESWDSKDLTKLDSLSSPKVGIWIVYNRGISSRPFRFSSVSAALSDGEFGFGYLGMAAFGSCELSPGPPPICTEGDEKAPLCRWGEAGDRFAELLALVTGDPDAQAQSPAEVESLKTLTAGKTIFFVSDDKWGAAFYFVSETQGWELVLVDTSDCSA